MAAVRFLLFITLYFPTLCSSQSDADALIKFKDSFTHGNLISWIPGPGISPCQWFGVMCHGKDIIGLHLTDLHLAGTIDVQPLLHLRHLRSISFMRNSFSGPIPLFNKLGSLKAIYLSHNQFNGEIPNHYFASMRSLKKVWLSENKFTGHIPESVMQLPHLLELHLEGNHFSGPIPPLKYPNVLTSFNISLNHLEGEIPESLAKFGVNSFRGNLGLCGKPVAKDCVASSPPPSGKIHNQNQTETDRAKAKAKAISDGKVILVATTIFFLLCIVIASLISATRRTKKDDKKKGVVSKGSVKDEVLPVQLAPESIHRRSGESNRRSKSGSRRDSTSSSTKSGMTDMVMVNDEKGEFGLQDLMKAEAEVLGNGLFGSAYKAKLSSGLSVVVKRMKGMNRLGKDAFDAEIRRFGKLKHCNVLTPLAYYFRKEEKLIVSSYMPKGSLSYILHGKKDLAHAKLNWPTRLKIVKGIARGLGFIHTEFATYELPHGNLKSSNVLITETYEPLLSDYAFQPMASPSTVAQVLFAYKSPEYLQYQQVSQKSDVYCLGIVILEIMTGKLPSQYLSDGKSGIDIVQWVQTSISEDQALELVDPEIASNASSTDNMFRLLEIGVACVESNPDKRLPLNEAITRIEEIS
ncbi:pollen receptor like kinase 3 [Hibiscus trionum]|uniref:Pollen receptor like kinase 3 n=1 Tax=Hibiscus trionum TaxID=183268 RepID=A0A9W7IC11_HIBTR|nr:pollen receptor like kinase 3 [Hibiscus trionum]